MSGFVFIVKIFPYMNRTRFLEFANYYNFPFYHNAMPEQLNVATFQDEVNTDAPKKG